MKISFLLIALSISCCSISTANENKQKEEPRKEVASQAGSSRDNPIIFKGVKDFDELKKKEDHYISENYPNYKQTTQIHFVHNGCHIYQVILKNELGVEKQLFFDTTEATLAYQKNNKEKIRRLKEEAEKAQKSKSDKNK